MFVEYLIVFILAILAGLWATAAGVFMELDPWLVFLVATVGSLVFTSVVLFAGGPVRDRIVAKSLGDMDDRIAASSMGATFERYGVPGFSIASIVFGPGLSLAGVLILGIDRKRFLAWYAPITVIGYGLATLFWVWIAS